MEMSIKYVIKNYEEYFVVENFTIYNFFYLFIDPFCSKDIYIYILRLE